MQRATKSTMMASAALGMKAASSMMRTRNGSGALEWVVAGGKARRASGTSVAAASGSREAIHTKVLLGSEHLSAVKTGVHPQPIFPGEAGLVGNGLLSRFRVTLDAAGSRLLLQRTAG